MRGRVVNPWDEYVYFDSYEQAHPERQKLIWLVMETARTNGRKLQPEERAT